MKSFEFEKDLLHRFFRAISIFVERNGFWRAVTSLAMIHAKHLVIYWNSKGHKAEAINDKLKNCFGATVPPYSAITYWCRTLNLKYDILVIRRGPGRPPEVDLDNAILTTLNKFPFHSLRSLSRVLKRPFSTIRDHFITAPIKRDVNLSERIQFSTGVA
jgi:hypothetical protein